MHILVNAANTKDLVVVSDGLCAEELLWLFQAALHALNLTHLRVQREAVRDPAIVTAKDQYLRIVEREAAHSVSRRPVVLPIDEDHRLPLLLVQIAIAVQSFNAVEGLFVLRVTPTNHVEEAPIEHANRVEVPAGIHLSDLGPLVLRNFVHFALLGGLVGVLRPRRKEEVLRSILESLMQVGKLVATAPVLHQSTALSLVSLFVDDEAVVGNDSSDLVFLFLATDAEHLVVDLNANEVLWQDVCVAQTYLCCRL